MSSAQRTAGEKLRIPVYFSGFSMALDFSMEIVSIQALWLLMLGDTQLYGVAFGGYDVGTALGGPLLGLLSDRWSPSAVFKAAVLLNCVGNLLYAVSFVSEFIWLILLGRFLSGFGSATLGLGLKMLSATATTDEERVDRISRFKLCQAFGWTGGPIFAFSFLPIPLPHYTDPVSLRLFNFYTMPAWFALLLNLCVLFPLCLVYLRAPPQPPPPPSSSSLTAPLSTASIPVAAPAVRRWEIAWLLFVQGMGTFLYYCVASNLFAFALAQYHILTNQSEQWVLYVSVAGGYTVAFTVFWTMRARIPARYLMVVGLFLFAAGLLCLCDFSGILMVNQGWLYYVGTTLAGAGPAFFYPGTNAQHVLAVSGSPRVGLFMGLLIMMGSLGRLFGPVVFSAIVPIDTLPGGECDPRSPSTYIVSGCYLRNAIVVMPILSVLCVILAIFATCYAARYKPRGTQLAARMTMRLSTRVSEIDTESRPSPASHDNDRKSLLSDRA